MLCIMCYLFVYSSLNIFSFSLENIQSATEPTTPIFLKKQDSSLSSNIQFYGNLAFGYPALFVSMQSFQSFLFISYISVSSQNYYIPYVYFGSSCQNYSSFSLPCSL